MAIQRRYYDEDPNYITIELPTYPPQYRRVPRPRTIQLPDGTWVPVRDSSPGFPSDRPDPAFSQGPLPPFQGSGPRFDPFQIALFLSPLLEFFRHGAGSNLYATAIQGQLARKRAAEETEERQTQQADRRRRERMWAIGEYIKNPKMGPFLKALFPDIDFPEIPEDPAAAAAAAQAAAQAKIAAAQRAAGLYPGQQIPIPGETMEAAFPGVPLPRQKGPFEDVPGMPPGGLMSGPGGVQPALPAGAPEPVYRGPVLPGVVGAPKPTAKAPETIPFEIGGRILQLSPGQVAGIEAGREGRQPRAESPNERQKRLRAELQGIVRNPNAVPEDAARIRQIAPILGLDPAPYIKQLQVQIQRREKQKGKQAPGGTTAQIGPAAPGQRYQLVRDGRAQKVLDRQTGVRLTIAQAHARARAEKDEALANLLGMKLPVPTSGDDAELQKARTVVNAAYFAYRQAQSDYASEEDPNVVRALQAWRNAQARLKALEVMRKGRGGTSVPAPAQGRDPLGIR